MARIKTEEVSNIAEQSQVNLNLQSGPTFSFDLIHILREDVDALLERASFRNLRWMRPLRRSYLAKQNDVGHSATEYVIDSFAALFEQRVDSQ